MKLIGLYIENFGGLHQYALEFSDGITVIQAPNGFGKTTLAEFIRAMFYGFPRKAKFLDKDRRQKYTPWNGAKAGGNLTFEHEGVRYRIERTFGAEPKGDTFKLIDLATGKKSDRFSREIGTELFQLDADSFERSTYMPQLQDQTSLTTAGIQAKLSDLVEDTNDINNFDKAMLALKARRSAFIPYRGSGGSVAEARARVSRLQEELEQTESKKEELAHCQGVIACMEIQLQQNHDEIAALREQITLASEAAAAAAARKQYDDLTARYQSAAAELASLREKYPRGIPTQPELDEMQKTADDLAALTAQKITTQTDLEAADFLKANAARFESRIPTMETLDAVQEKCEAYADLSARAQRAELTDSEQKQYESLRAMFDGNGLTEEKLDELAQLHHRYVRQQAALLALPEPEPQHVSLLPTVLMVLVGLLGIALGAVLLTLQTLLPGGILAGCGLMALIAAAVMYTGLRKTKMEIAAQEKQWDDTLAAVQQLEDQMHEALAPYYGRVTDCGMAISRLRLDRSVYLDLQEEAREEAQRRSWLTEQAAAYEKELREFFGAFFAEAAPERFQTLLFGLRQDADSYRRAAAQVAQWRERKTAHEEALKQCTATLTTFLSRFGLEQETDVRRQLHQLRDDGRALQDAALREEQLSRQLTQFRAEYAEALAAEPVQTADADSLKRREFRLNMETTELTRELLTRRQQLENLQAQLNRLPELRDSLEQWQEKKNADQKKSQTLDETMEFLQRAKDSLSTSYLGPIRENFAGYLERLMGEKEQLLVSPDLEVQLQRQGQARELAYFSAGQTDLVMLCMRLALVDALFGGEKPFVILDDPFVNLDDERTAEALALLKELGRERQILYLTCSSSRSL